MNHQRRTLLKSTVATGTIAIAISAGLLTPQAVLAAWPKAAFNAKSVGDALNTLMGAKDAVASKDIQVDAPDIAENGAVVSISIKTSIANAEQISILVKENSLPLAASYVLSPDTEGYITGRIKMAKTSDIIAVVKAGNKLYMAKKSVKVTLGGCGG